MALPDPAGSEDWGRGVATCGPHRQPVKIDIPGHFHGEGDGEVVGPLAHASVRYKLIGSIVLAVAAVLMFGIAALVMVFGPSDRASIIYPLCIPAAVLGILAFSFAGISTFKINASATGLSVAGRQDAAKK